MFQGSFVIKFFFLHGTHHSYPSRRRGCFLNNKHRTKYETIYLFIKKREQDFSFQKVLNNDRSFSSAVTQALLRFGLMTTVVGYLATIITKCHKLVFNNNRRIILPPSLLKTWQLGSNNISRPDLQKHVTQGH